MGWGDWDYFVFKHSDILQNPFSQCQPIYIQSPWDIRDDHADLLLDVSLVWQENISATSDNCINHRGSVRFDVS